MNGVTASLQALFGEPGRIPLDEGGFSEAGFPLGVLRDGTVVSSFRSLLLSLHPMLSVTSALAS